jgi:hypothetical protein
MSLSVANTPYSIGYMDAANGIDLNLIEIAMQNKDGNFVTSQVSKSQQQRCCAPGADPHLPPSAPQPLVHSSPEMCRACLAHLCHQNGDITGAASALFKTDAWPKTPTASYSAVSVLNQPGPTTFPIVVRGPPAAPVPAASPAPGARSMPGSPASACPALANAAAPGLEGW